jgi:hypothetical protein
MDEGWSRHGTQSEYRRREAPGMRRPDRIALWAVGLAVVGMVAAAASAHGSTGTSAAGHFSHHTTAHVAPLKK